MLFFRKILCTYLMYDPLQLYFNLPKNSHFLPPDTHTKVCVSGVKKMLVFRKILCAYLVDVSPATLL